jgi:OmpR family response regulator RpaB
VEFSNYKLLIIDTEIETSQVLAKNLAAFGYQIIIEFDGKTALSRFHNEKPDLLIIDLLLLKQDGYEICRKIRECSKVPIVILASLDSILDRVMSFELGANDYITKPFALKELEARIRALLKVHNLYSEKSPSKKKIKIGGLFIDMDTREILKYNHKVRLTSIEYSILELLIYHAGKTISRLLILDNVWGYKPEREVDTRIVDVHISRLRSKLEENPRKPSLILTIRNTGYMLKKH